MIYECVYGFTPSSEYMLRQSRKIANSTMRVLFDEAGQVSEIFSRGGLKLKVDGIDLIKL